MSSSSDISAKINSELYNSVYKDTDQTKFHKNLIDDLIKQYKDKSELYDTQKDILFLQDSNLNKTDNIRDKIQLNKRKIVYNEKDNRNNDKVFNILKIIFLILSILSIILLTYKPIDLSIIPSINLPSFGNSSQTAF